jgi:hypothetical protein
MRRGSRLPVENPAAPLTGYKLAQLLLATDGRSVAFAGLSVGARRVYTIVDEAECIVSAKHSPPARRGNCGFYCVHTADAARALASTETYGGGVLLDVLASGRFIRYEEGLRYQKQRIRAVRIGLCGCGRRAEVFVDGGAGLVGWRRLLPVCEVCAGFKPQVGRDRIAALLPGVPVTLDDGVCPLDDLPSSVWDETGHAKTALLAAEVALLQARLDSVQTRLASVEDTGRQPPKPAAD